MNTEELKQLGLNDEQIKGVMAAHGKVINPIKEQVTTLTSERDTAKAQLTTVTGQLDQLQRTTKAMLISKLRLTSSRRPIRKLKKMRLIIWHRSSLIVRPS